MVAWSLYQAFNIARGTCGRLFAGRHKALAVDGGGNGYLRTVCDYVHLNPVRAKLIRGEAELEGYRWSNYGQYVSAPWNRPLWLRVDRLFGEMGIPKDSEAGRKEFARRMELRRKEQSAEAYEESRNGWCVGSE